MVGRKLSQPTAPSPIQVAHLFFRWRVVALSRGRRKKSLGVRAVRSYHFGTPGETSDSCVSGINRSTIPFSSRNILCVNGKQGRKGPADRAPGSSICFSPRCCARSTHKRWHSLPLETVLGSQGCELSRSSNSQTLFLGQGSTII